MRARVLAFAAILLAGLCGGLIGYGFVGLQCHGNCTTPDGLGAVVGGALAAGGVAIVAVLTLRAMGEWRTIKEERALAEASGTGDPESRPADPTQASGPSGPDGDHLPPAPV